MSAILVAAVCLCALSLALQASRDDCAHAPIQEVVPKKAYGYIRSVFAPSMYDCAAECQLSPLCLSFIFDPEKRTCQRLTEKKATTNDSFTVGSGVFFSNIHDWKMSLTGACGATSCGANSRCTLGRNGQPLCDIYDVPETTSRSPTSSRPSTSHYDQVDITEMNPAVFPRKKQQPRGDIGMTCTGGDDCFVNMTTCYHSQCLCNPGYSHNITSNSCDRECKTYANTLTLYKELTILGHNLKRVRLNGGFKHSVATCTKACAEETSFVCKSADFRPNRVCLLSSEGYLDVSARERERHQRKWWMGVRRCQ